MNPMHREKFKTRRLLVPQCRECGLTTLVPAAPADLKRNLLTEADIPWWILG